LGWHFIAFIGENQQSHGSGRFRLQLPADAADRGSMHFQALVLFPYSEVPIHNGAHSGRLYCGALYNDGLTMPRNRKLRSGIGLVEGQQSNPTWQVIESLVNGGTDPSRLMELYYWTREPGVIEVIRAYLALPEATQRCLGDLLLSSNPGTIEAVMDAQGRMMLTQTEAEPAPPLKNLRRSSGG
jgi:hypothetical protein